MSDGNIDALGGHPDSGAPGLASSAILPGPAGGGSPNSPPVLDTLLVSDPRRAALGECLPSRWAPFGDEPGQGCDFFIVLNVARIWNVTFPLVVADDRLRRFRKKPVPDAGHEDRFTRTIARTWLHELGHAWLKPYGMKGEEEERALLWVQNRLWVILDAPALRTPPR